MCKNIFEIHGKMSLQHNIFIRIGKLLRDWNAPSKTIDRMVPQRKQTVGGHWERMIAKLGTDFGIL